MLTNDAQSELFDRYCNKPLKKSINQNFAFEHLKEQFVDELENVEGTSSIMYLDISNFSTKVDSFTSVQVKDYLEEYYSVTMPFIKQFNGQIDKVMGDGIIVVFSHVFDEIKSAREASNKAFYCSKEIIEQLYTTDFESKAAIGYGKLFFCKTGVAQIYEEFTAVGYPYTVAYRLESIAEKNQILLMRNTGLSQRVENSSNNYLKYWRQDEITVNLKGVNSNKIHRVQY